MDSGQIKKALRRIKIFKGVYAACDIPVKHNKLPSAYVVNTDNCSLPGTHWVALLIRADGVVEYFDSFGLDYAMWPEIKKYIEWHTTGIVESQSQQLQHTTAKTCGLYCIRFIEARSVNMSMQHFVALFSRVNTLSNEKLIKIL